MKGFSPRPHRVLMPRGFTGEVGAAGRRPFSGGDRMPLPADEATRVLLYSHDSQGLGHVRRNLALAHALAEQLPRLTGRPVTGPLDRKTGPEAHARDR